MKKLILSIAALALFATTAFAERYVTCLVSPIRNRETTAVTEMRIIPR